MKRLFLIFLVLAALVLVPFVIFGERIEEKMSLENTVDTLRKQGSWAWAVGVGLLIADLFLPILGTVVMSALGLIYGWLIGGLFASLGSIGAGLLAYGLCRGAGRGIAEKIAGKDGLEEGERLFSGEAGGWMIALSRWMPVLPEVMACLAGLTRMPLPKFTAALACGSVPLGFTFATIGAAGLDRPGLTLVLSACLPPVIWLILRPVFFRGK
jgi:uncharacterized membrane protein YdjX (TVP38/TMEM64 family)